MASTIEKIKRLQREHGLSDAAMSEIMGRAKATTHAYLNEKRPLSRAAFERVAAYFHLSEEELAGDDGIPKKRYRRIQWEISPEEKNQTAGKLKALQNENELSNTEMAEIIGKKAISWRNYLTSTVPIPWEVLERLSEYFEIPMAELIGEDGVMERPLRKPRSKSHKQDA